MAQLLSNFGADLTGLRQGASCAAREKTPFFLQPIRVCRHALVKTALVTKANDQPEGPLTTFRMETFDFGLDEDGDPITTSVVSDDVPDKSLAKGKPKRLNHGEQVAMKMLREAL